MRQLLLASGLVPVLIMSAQAVTLSINGDANIFGAGHGTPPAPSGGSGGTRPPGWSFTPGLGQFVTFSSVSGAVAMSGKHGLMNGPDGSILAVPTMIGGWEGISGIRADRVGFLAGVFLGPDEPVESSVAALDFSPSQIGIGFSTLAPAIGQLFFIGDGLTGSGSGALQEFLIPAGATQLFLGFADAYGYSGPPGQYQDNGGTLAVTFQISSPRPGYSLLGLLTRVTLVGLIVLLVASLVAFLYYKRHRYGMSKA